MHNSKGISGIGNTKGNGTTQVRRHYTFADEKPLIATNYYRLKSVDLNGSTEFFKAIALEYSNKKMFSVSPNPTDGQPLTYNINLLPQSESSVLIYDNMGKPVAQFVANDFSQTPQFSQPLVSGVYFARFVSQDFVKVSRFPVQ